MTDQQEKDGQESRGIHRVRPDRGQRPGLCGVPGAVSVLNELLPQVRNEKLGFTCTEIVCNIGSFSTDFKPRTSDSVPGVFE